MDPNDELRKTGETPFGNGGGIARGPTTTRAAIYGRISTADGRQEADNQLDELRRFAATQNWEVVGEYIDYESGGGADRPEFKRMWADAAQRRFDVLLFWALDRLTREGALQTLQYLNQLSKYGVAFRSFREPFIDSCGAFSDAVIAILGTIAKQERARIQERVQAAMNRVRLHGTKSGKPVGRPRVIVDADMVVRLRDAEHLSWPEIARRTRSSSGTVRRVYASAGARRRALPKSVGLESL
jgi:DNA invertase Pin-like site-specific DNA recombinase